MVNKINLGKKGLTVVIHEDIFTYVAISFYV